MLVNALASERKGLAFEFRALQRHGQPQDVQLRSFGQRGEAAIHHRGYNLTDGSARDSSAHSEGPWSVALHF
jgi:hypothetical protein